MCTFKTRFLGHARRFLNRTGGNTSSTAHGTSHIREESACENVGRGEPWGVSLGSAREALPKTRFFAPLTPMPHLHRLQCVFWVQHLKPC